VNRLRCAFAAAISFCLLAGAACSSGDGKTLPAPRPSSTTTTTVAVDFSEVALAPIAPGKAPPVTRPPGPGTASIAGKVVDTSGAPVPQALVRATYFLDPAKPDVIEALSGDDGRYRFDRLYGGRWRIRAWKAPVMATLEQPAFFLSAGEQKALDLKVRAVPDLEVTSRMAPDPPLVGWPAELAVLVVSQTVNPEGKVERSPVGATEVALTAGSSWAVEGPSAKLTDADGTARWTMYCGDEGVHTASLTVAAREFPLTLPSCLSPASTTTATTATTGPSSSTSATKPKPRTTTTTRPRSTSSTRPAVLPR
jgi:hypothetical protein